MAKSKSTHTLILALKDRLAAPIKAATQKMAQRVKKLANRVTTASRRISRSMARIATNVGKATAAFVAMGVAAGAFAMTRILKGVSERSDEFAKLGRQIGFSAERLQTLEFAAGRQGASWQKVQGGLGTFNKRLGELRHQTGGLYTYLKKSEPAFAELLVNTKDSTEAYDLFIQKLSATKGEAAKAALAAAAFSKGNSAAFIRLVANGTDELLKLEEAARRYRPPLDKKQLSLMEAHQDSALNAKTAMGGLADIIALRLAPFVTRLNNGFADFIANNRELIGAKIEAVFKRIRYWVSRIDFKALAIGLEKVTKKASDFIAEIDFEPFKTAISQVAAAIASMPWQKIIAGAGEAFRHIGNLVTRLADMNLLVPAIGAALGVMITANILSAIGGLFTIIKGEISVIWAFNAALLANPIVLIVAGIVAAIGLVVLGVYKLIKHWNNAEGAVGRFVQRTKALLSGLIAFILEKGAEFFDAYIGGWIGLAHAIVATFKSLPEFFVRLGTQIANGLTRKIAEAVNGVVGIVNKMPGINIEPVVVPPKIDMQAFQKLGDNVSAAFLKGAEFSVASDSLSGVIGDFKDANHRAKSLLKEAANDQVTFETNHIKGGAATGSNQTNSGSTSDIVLPTGHAINTKALGVPNPQPVDIPLIPNASTQAIAAHENQKNQGTTTVNPQLPEVNVNVAPASPPDVNVSVFLDGVNQGAFGTDSGRTNLGQSMTGLAYDA